MLCLTGFPTCMGSEGGFQSRSLNPKSNPKYKVLHMWSPCFAPHVAAPGPLCAHSPGSRHSHVMQLGRDVGT